MLTFLGMEPRGLEACSYSSRVVDESSFTNASSEEPFRREARAVLDELGQSIGLLSRIRWVDESGEPRALSRDEAILAGLMVRVAKLHQSLVAACLPPRMETFGLLLRPAIEAAVDLRYLIEHGSPDTFEAFVGDSLRLDKQLLERVESAVQQRGGMIMPMEYGLVEGVKRAFRVAGIDPATVSATARPGWSKGGARSRFQALGMEDLYVPLFGVASTYTHASWQEIVTHHLSLESPDAFLPSPAFGDVQPQALLMAIDVIAAAGSDYLGAAAPASRDREVLQGRIEFCVEKQQLIAGAFRNFRGMPTP